MKILVPVDGSPASAHAVKLAIDQVKAATGASLVLVNVQNRATAGVAEATGLMPSGWIEQEEEQSAADALQNAVTACREAGVTYGTRSERGRLRQRSIVWPARKTSRISSWEPEDWAGCAACSLAR